MVNEQKKTFVQELTAAIGEYPLIGLINLHQLPAQQLQKMRALLLKNGIKIVMARKKLLELALSGSAKNNIQQLKEKITGMPALLFSKSNPFALYKVIQKNKSPAAAKAGQISPKDLVVKAGPTNFIPGPIISELAAVGIKTKVENGKLAVISDTTIVKEGAVISAKVAETLKRLDIKPMEIGLSLVAVWENGLIFEAKQLHIDENEFMNKLTTAAQWALNLAIEVAYTSADTIELLIQKAFREAKALSLEQNIITDLTAEEILGRVEMQAKEIVNAAKLIIPEKVKSTNTEKPHLSKKNSESLKTDETMVGSDAQKLIKETMAKNFDKDNKTILAERGMAKSLSAEKLVEEELNAAQQEESSKPKPDKSVKQAEDLYEKLKKTGTLRDQ